VIKRRRPGRRAPSLQSLAPAPWDVVVIGGGKRRPERGHGGSAGERRVLLRSGDVRDLDTFLWAAKVERRLVV
jgi:hypothetical protein